jgi:DNA N-6-adenine-methyltransferase (Dam)
VRASATYTEADDGLAQPWHGRTWLNPPYGREIGEWIDKLVSEYETGQVTEAMALIPARVDTQWFRCLDPYPRCYVYGRLVFSNSENSAPFPAAIPYLGPNVERFIEVFSSVGGIWMRMEATPTRLDLALEEIALERQAAGGQA